MDGCLCACAYEFYKYAVERVCVRFVCQSMCVSVLLLYLILFTLLYWYSGVGGGAYVLVCLYWRISMHAPVFLYLY